MKHPSSLHRAVAPRLILLIAVTCGPVTAQDVVDGSGSAASQRYVRLMEQAEGPGRQCMIAQTTSAGVPVAEAFVKEAKFIDLRPDKPIRVTLPDDFYNPQGGTVSFDTQALAIYRKNPLGPYISMTRTTEGIRIEPRIALEADAGKLLCVRYYGITLKYHPAPTGP